jgi:hypothetical protein
MTCPIIDPSLDEIPDVEYDFAITMGCGDRCLLVRARNRGLEFLIPRECPVESSARFRV